jgi:DNA-binding transcriptional LysR family regulator
MDPADRPAQIRPAIRSRLRLKHFELFRHLCELHTMRKAAAASHMTQPAATKLVQELEDMFQAVLFTRNRRGMQLTQHGEILRRHIGTVLADIGQISAELDRFTRGGGGLIRLGIIPSLSPTLLAHCINELLESHPGSTFATSEGTTDDLMQRLARGELDVMFGRVLHAGHPASLRAAKVYTEAFDIVCGRRHPLARQAGVKWSELARASWVLPPVGSPLREITESMFTARGNLRPVAAVASSSFHQMRYVIAGGQLLGVLPHSIAAVAEAEGDIVVLRPRSAAKVAPISVIVRGDIELSPLVAAFEAIAVRAAKGLGLA